MVQGVRLNRKIARVFDVDVSTELKPRTLDPTLKAWC